MNAQQVVEELKQRFPNEPEYIQAVSQVRRSIEDEYNKHHEFEKSNCVTHFPFTFMPRPCNVAFTFERDSPTVARRYSSSGISSVTSKYL